MSRYLVLLCLLTVSSTLAHSETTSSGLAHQLQAARTLYEARSDSEALAAYQAIILAAPETAEAHFGVAQLHRRTKNWPAALPFYERAAELDPQKSFYHACLAEAYGNVAKKASLFSKLSLARKSRASLQRAIDLDPNNLTYLEGMVSFCIEAPSIAGGGFEHAEKIAASIAKIDPYRGALQEAAILEAKKSWRMAAESLHAALLIAPPLPDATHAKLWLRTGIAHERAKEVAHARLAFEEAIALDPSLASARDALARINSSSKN